MSATIGFADALEAALTAHAADDVQVQAEDPGEYKDPIRGSVWVKQVRSTASYRSVGPRGDVAHQNREENVTALLGLLVYREAETHQEAAAAARARADQIVAGVETAIEDDLTLGGRVRWMLLAGVQVDVVAVAKGWAATGELTVTAEK